MKVYLEGSSVSNYTAMGLGSPKNRMLNTSECCLISLINTCILIRVHRSYYMRRDLMSQDISCWSRAPQAREEMLFHLKLLRFSFGAKTNLTLSYCIFANISYVYVC
jgi:hypothetical protein